MATLTIGDKKVTVDDAFLSLPPEQQQATVEEIAKSLGAPQQPQQPERNFRGDSAGSSVDAALIGAARGVTFDTADEIRAGVRAAADWIGNPFKLGDGQDFGPAYDRHLEFARGMQDQVREENPLSAFAGEMAGAALIPGGAMKAGASTGVNALRMGLAGGAAGGLYGFGAGEDGFASRAGSAGVGALVGGTVGAATPFALKPVQRALDNRATRKAVEAAADAATSPGAVKAQSQAAFRAAREKGVVLNSDAAMPLIDEIAKVQTLHKRFTPDANALVDDILADLSQGKVPLDALEDLHRSAGMAVNKNRIANPQDAAAAGEIGRKIDEYLMNLPDEAIASASGAADEAVAAFREGRALWKSFRNSERLQEIVDNAALADNPALAIKRGFRSILTNKNKRATYSKAELQVMQQVLRDTQAGSWVQRLIGYGTGLSRQVAGTAAGYGLGGPIGAALGSAAATKLGSMAKDAASDAALAAGERAARFSATGGQFARPDPVMLPTNALRRMALPSSAAGVNLWNQ
jgi:hypothetical protein